MTINVTITKPGVTDQFGRAMTVGTTYAVEDNFGLSLIGQLKATDTSSSLVTPGITQDDALNVQYVNAAAIAAPTAQMLRSYSTVFVLNASPYTRYRTNGTILVPEAQYTLDASGNITGLAGYNAALAAKQYVGTRILTPTQQSGFSQGGNAFTWSLMCAVPQAFTAVRLILMNSVASNITGVTAAVSVGGDGTDLLNNAGTWANATFSGAGSVSLPSGSAADPTITLSDWVSIASVTRTAGVGAFPLVYVRCLTPAANATAPLTGLGVTITGWATKADGMLWALRFQQGDFVTTPSGMTGSSDPSASPIAGVQFLTKTGAIISAAFFGDSITSAYTGATVPGDSWCHRAVTNYGANMVCANLGVAGQTSSQWLTRAQRYIPAMKPYMAWWPTASPNDGTPTAAIVNTEASNAAQFLDLCRQNGTIPVFWTGLPRTTDNTNAASSYTIAQDALRKALSVQMIGMGLVSSDIAAVMSDTTSAAVASKWAQASYTSDGLHPSETGHAVIAPIALATLQAFVR